MSIVTVASRPELTLDEAVAILRERLGERYKVYRYVSPVGHASQDFIVEKDSMTGVRVRLKQAPDSTAFICQGYAPSRVKAFILGCVLVALINRPTVKALVEEVEESIRTTPQFQGH